MESKDRKEHLEVVKYLKEPLGQIQALIRKFDKGALPYLEYGYILYDAHKGYFTSHGKDKSKRIIHYPSSRFHGKKFDKVLFDLRDDLKAGYELEIQLREEGKDRAKRKHSDKEKRILRRKEIAQEILALEYKIHLMPKADYMLPVIEKIFEACERDPELRDLIEDMKFRNTIKEKEELDPKAEIFPNIVIYPKLGLENFEKLLKKLQLIFQPYRSEEIGTGIIPRYSLQIDPLINYAQGGGDIKNAVIQMIRDKSSGKVQEELIGDFVTKRRIHYAGSRHPSLSSALDPKKKKDKDMAGDRGDRKKRKEIEAEEPDWASPEWAVQIEADDDRPPMVLTTPTEDKPSKGRDKP